MHLVEHAKILAFGRHSRQIRKYINEPLCRHLEAVVTLLVEHGVEEPHVIAAAYLHDVLEDTNTTLRELVSTFGEDVAELVYWLTENEIGNREERLMMMGWRFSHAPWGAKLIKLADIIDNAATIHHARPPFLSEYMKEKSGILDRMAKAEGERITNHPLYRTARRMVEINRETVRYSQAAAER